MNQTPSYQNHPVAGLHQARPSPSVTPQTSYNAAQYQQRPNYPNNPNYNGATPNPAMQQASQPVRWQQPQTQAPTPAQPTAYNATAYNRTAQPAQTQYAAQPSQAAQLQRGTEVYTLADTSNMSIPKEIRDQFPQDEQGRILFFATPPLDNTQTITGKTAVEKDHPLEHSESYVQSLKKRKSDAMLGTDKMDTDETKITASKRLANLKFQHQSIRLSQYSPTRFRQAQMKNTRKCLEKIGENNLFQTSNMPEIVTPKSMKKIWQLNDKEMIFETLTFPGTMDNLLQILKVTLLVGKRISSRETTLMIMIQVYHSDHS